MADDDKTKQKEKPKEKDIPKPDDAAKKFNLKKTMDEALNKLRERNEQNKQIFYEELEKYTTDTKESFEILLCLKDVTEEEKKEFTDRLGSILSDIKSKLSNDAKFPSLIAIKDIIESQKYTDIKDIMKVIEGTAEIYLKEARAKEQKQQEEAKKITRKKIQLVSKEEQEELMIQWIKSKDPRTLQKSLCGLRVNDIDKTFDIEPAGSDTYKIVGLRREVLPDRLRRVDGAEKFFEVLAISGHKKNPELHPEHHITGIKRELGKKGFPFTEEATRFLIHCKHRELIQEFLDLFTIVPGGPGQSGDSGQF